MSETVVVLLVLPIVIIELGLLVIALRDLVRPERRVRGESKLTLEQQLLYVRHLARLYRFKLGG